MPLPLLAGVSLLRSDSRGLALCYEPGELRLEHDESGQTGVSLADAERRAQPGELDLPTKVVRVGIPQTGGVRLSYRVGAEHRYDDILIAEAAVVAAGSPGVKSPESRVPSPNDWVELGPVQRLRDVRFVELTMNPCRYQPEEHRLRVCDRIEVELSFEDRPEPGAQADPLDPVIEQMLVNGGQAVSWKVGGQTDRADFFARAPFWVKVKVESAGIYRVTGRELEKGGVSLAGIDPATLALFTLGEHELNGPYPDTLREVPVFVTGDGDGRFDPDDWVVFYGLGADHWAPGCSNYVTNYYTRHNVYWLCWGGRAGKRMQQGLGPDTTGTPVRRIGSEKVRLEQDNDCPAQSGLLWVWRTIAKDSYRDAVRMDIELGLEYPVEIRRVSGRLFSESGGNHLEAYLNGRLLDTFSFDVAGPTSPYDFKAEAMQPANFSSNRLELELSGQGAKKVYLDYLEIEYTRRLSLYRGPLHFRVPDTGTFRFVVKDVAGEAFVLDVTDPYEPRMSDGFERLGDSVRFCRRLTRPSEFAVASVGQLRVPHAIVLRRPGRLRQERTRVEYWVVTPAEFLPAAEKLVRYRTGNVAGIPGCRAGVAVLEDIYDDYGFGFEEPGAVKWFFAEKRPSYGLLCGDATYDYRNNLNRLAVPGVPAYETGFGFDPSGVTAFRTPSYDSWYADFEGAGGSPDMILGRVTARTGAELSRFVEKLIRYERGPAGMWNKRLLLLADDEWKKRGEPDDIGFGHTEQCEEMAVLPGRTLEPVKVYLTEYPFTDVKRKEQADKELMRQLNRGALALIFFGHGDAFDLCHGSVFDVSQVDAVDNANRSPFCYFGSCSVGRFEDTRYECIAEELVRKPDGGAIATVAATRATGSEANRVFARNMFVPLFRDSAPDSVIGTAFFAAWPLNRLYHLFGDPATRIRRPGRSSQELLARPDTLRPGAKVRARGVIELPGADYSWVLFGPRRARRYVSTRGTMTYVLGGLELGRGEGKAEFGRVGLEAVFPLGVSLDTVFVGDGFYAPVPRSCRISLSAWNGSTDLSVLADTLTFAAEALPTEDQEGPEAGFYLGSRRLLDDCQVPASFELEGCLSDPSGIFTVPGLGFDPRFFVNRRQNETELTDVLVFDDSSSATARFRVPVRLNGPIDTLWVIANDNMLNRTAARVAVRPLAAEVRPAVDSLLVYPNPVRRDGCFTFRLNRNAAVRVRLFTLQGRMIRDLGELPGVFGYNQVQWDGRDKDGSLLANGVYLVSVTARTSGKRGSDAVSARERFLVMR